MHDRIMQICTYDLFQFAYIPSWYEQLYELSQLAAPEPWRFRQPSYETQNTETPILERYINQVFRKQAIDYSCAPEGQAGQIFYLNQEFACFHTGLNTKDYKSIYMCFNRNKRLDSLRKWCFKGFTTEDSPWFKYVLLLPSRPTYAMRQWMLYSRLIYACSSFTSSSAASWAFARHGIAASRQTAKRPEIILRSMLRIDFIVFCLPSIKSALIFNLHREIMPLYQNKHEESLSIRCIDLLEKPE